MNRAEKRALKKKNKELGEVFDLGKQYDNETDPVRKAELKKEIDARCEALKGPLQATLEKIQGKRPTEDLPSE